MTFETVTSSGTKMVRSEIGSFPSDWPIRRLDDIAGGVSVGLVINPSTYFSERGTIPMLLGSQVSANKIDHEAAKRITPQSNGKIPASILRAGDLVTVRVGDPGTTAVVTEGLDGCNCASMMIIRRNAAFNSTWLSHVLNSPIGGSQVANVQYGTAQKQFNIGDAVGFLIPVPPKAEQDALAAALSDIDTLIGSLEQLLTKKRQIKQGVMQELLTGMRRLPGCSSPWRNVQIGQLGVFLKGAGIKRDEASSGDLPCVRYGEIYTAHSDYIRTVLSWISPTVASTATKLQQGDLLFACSGETKEEIGKCVAFIDKFVAYAGGDIVILRPNAGVDSMFMGYMLNTPTVVRQKASRGQGDAVVHISAAALGQINIELPDHSEQAAISRVLADMDTALAEIEHRLTKARALKQGMAQALLTGRIRLVEAAA